MKKTWQYKIDQIAENAIKRAKKSEQVVTCRCGETPGGTKHIGNFNDNLRSYYVYLSIKKRGYPTRHIQTRDNMDPFRKLPSKFCDLERNWHISSPKLIRSYNKYVGMPLYFIPDPLGCCKNYAEHFRKIYESECKKMGLIDTQYFSTYKLYKSGMFNHYIKMIFEQIDKTRKIDLSIEHSKPKNYIPIWAICPKCRKITGRITKFNLENETVEYECTGRNLTKKYPAKGCHHKGIVKWNNGNVKMDWEFEWPAQMLIFNTTVEPFGKEHFIGSWPFSKKVIKEIYHKELPEVFFYEYFLIEKKKMATRHGNVTTLSDILKFLEPQIIRYIYTKRPRKQRSLNLSNIVNLVNEYDYAEKVYFGLEKVHNEKELQKITRNYELSNLEIIPKIYPNRIPYSRFIKALKRFPIDKAKKLLFKGLNKQEKIYNSKRILLVKNYLDLVSKS